MAEQTSAKQLFDLLVSKNFDPELLDSAGKPATNPAEAEVFSFDFTTQSGNDYGTVVIMIGSDNTLEVYFGDNVGKTMEGADKNEWYEFLEQLKHFSTKNLMEFGLKNINRLRYSMQGQAAIAEGLFESWHGNKHTSYNDKPEHVRLMIKHKKPIGEGDARYRYVESLFVETSDGERFKLPFTKLAGGRAMCEHVRNGGKPYDVRGQHIAGVVEELNVLSRFRRANANQVFEGDTAELVAETNAYYENLNRVLKGLGTNRGYTNYFESWNPAEITEQDVVIESIKHLFVRETIDTRIEQALPLLARIQKQGQAMKEANIFESWANRLVEGTWSIPDTPEKQSQLVELLLADFPVGADATNATEQLYDLIGDDVLFDQLQTLADQDANADARPLVLARLQELADNPDVAKVIAQLDIDTEPTEVDTEVEIDQDVAEGTFRDEDGVEDEDDVEEGLGGAVVGGALGALAAGPVGARIGATLGNAVGDALDDEDEVDETIDPKNPKDYEIPAYLRKQQGQTPVTLADIRAKDAKAKREYEKRLGNANEADDLSTFEEDLDTDGVMMTKQSNMSSESVDPMLSRIKSLAGIMVK
jgi:hypothetical protein